MRFQFFLPQKVFLDARPLLFRTTVVGVLSAAWLYFLLCRDCRRAEALHQSDKREVVRPHFLRLALFAHNRLHSVKKFLCNQRLVSSLKYLSLVFHQSGVEDVLEEGVRLADGHIVAEERFEFLVLAPLAQFAQVVVSGGVEFKEFFDFCCLVLVYVNPARLGVIEIAEWCKHRPDAVANFLPHTSRDVLAEIVYIIFALAERNLEHKQSLRRRFKPKRRKFEGTNQAAIYHMYDFASVYTVAS
ncbi:hypothetical protein A3H15_02100 [Candidatus Kaiserbacteria bacterium RIFCSPLOWO2_12_FULL_50_28]|uniref:Uncharacterized protein n=1 Tax=Candidatus Kaiserbacteria bacterium RIFCSPLOWO2_12_FULL_50_28 TaxID=1798527 RepID=A0A1F6FRJ7_9BACT|nr:MAG: hypothetical protein A3H15_02100 [Candidatus Kaiserbacteria bacterium RIFCSPLOWO2_12_FULL_50_28]